MPRTWRRRILLPHTSTGNPFLPDTGGDAGGGGGAAPAAPPPTPTTPTAPAAPAAPAAPTAAPPATTAATASADGEPGFPANTPVADMTPEQAAAYWKAQSRKHENRHLEALGLKSADELAQLRKDAADAAELRKAQMSDQELAIAAARDQAAEEAKKTFGARLALAEFRAVSGGKVTAEDLTALRLDPSAFLTEDGEPDTDAITAVVARISPSAPAAPPPVHTGGGSTGGGTTLADRIAAATKDGDLKGSIALKVGSLPQKK